MSTSIYFSAPRTGCSRVTEQDGLDRHVASVNRHRYTCHERGFIGTQPRDGIRDFFTDRGYQGLYSGETENMIHARKGLQEAEHILDFMGSDELIANAFRASLARQRLERDKTRDHEQANQIHYQAGRKVRQTIQEFGGTVPEQLPTPKKSFGQLEREEQKRIEQGKQSSLFPDEDNEDG